MGTLVLYQKTKDKSRRNSGLRRGRDRASGGQGSGVRAFVVFRPCEETGSQGWRLGTERIAGSWLFFALCGRGDPVLEEYEVEEVVELEAHFAEMGYALETEALAEAEGGGVFRVDSGDHGVF